MDRTANSTTKIIYSGRIFLKTLLYKIGLENA